MSTRANLVETIAFLRLPIREAFQWWLLLLQLHFNMIFYFPIPFHSTMIIPAVVIYGLKSNVLLSHRFKLDCSLP